MSSGAVDLDDSAADEDEPDGALVRPLQVPHVHHPAGVYGGVMSKMKGLLGDPLDKEPPTVPKVASFTNCSPPPRITLLWSNHILLKFFNSYAYAERCLA